MKASTFKRVDDFCANVLWSLQMQISQYASSQKLESIGTFNQTQAWVTKRKRKLEQKTDKHRKKNSTWKANSTWVYFDHKRRNFLQTPESHSHGKKLAVELLKKPPEKNLIRDGGNVVTWVRILFRHLEKILGLY